jgi:hypothetical protein
MRQGERTWGVGHWGSLAAPLVALLAGCAPTAPRDVPPMPADVRAEVREVEAAFASAKTDPPTFVKLAKEALPRLREALQRWNETAPNPAHRSAIRGWALQAGQVETAVAQLPAAPSPAELRTVRDAWTSFRGALP